MEGFAEAAPWSGYPAREGRVDGRACKIVSPERATGDRRWAWRAEFFGAFPSVDLELVGRGYHLVYMDVTDHYGCPKAVVHWDRMYEWVRRHLDLHPKAALIGLSRGGLMVYNWAVRNPDRVACVYADNPVCDPRSWPGGFGTGRGSPEDWRKLREAYGSASGETIPCPLDHAEIIARAGIPVVHVCGDADEVVPMAENTVPFLERYRRHSDRYRFIVKPGQGHHPHGPEDPCEVADAIEEAFAGK